MKLTTSRRDRRISSVPPVQVVVLPEDPVVLFVHADRVLDRVRLALFRRQHGVEVVDHAETVASELE